MSPPEHPAANLCLDPEVCNWPSGRCVEPSRCKASTAATTESRSAMPVAAADPLIGAVAELRRYAADEHGTASYLTKSEARALVSLLIEADALTPSSSPGSSAAYLCGDDPGHELALGILTAASVRCGRAVDPGADYPHPCVLREGHDGPCDPRPPETRSAAQDRRPVPLMEGLRNLEKGYDRKFALSYCADGVWTALEALEKIAALAQSPSWEIAHDALNGKLHPPSDEGKAPAAAGNGQGRSETGDGSPAAYPQVRGPVIDLRALLVRAADALADAADPGGAPWMYRQVEREVRTLIAALDGGGAECLIAHPLPRRCLS